jgi:hypothetical protein
MKICNLMKWNMNLTKIVVLHILSMIVSFYQDCRQTLRTTLMYFSTFQTCSICFSNKGTCFLSKQLIELVMIYMNHFILFTRIVNELNVVNFPLAFTLHNISIRNLWHTELAMSLTSLFMISNYHVVVHWICQITFSLSQMETRGPGATSLTWVILANISHINICKVTFLYCH